MSLHPGTDGYNPAGNSEFAGADLRFTRNADALALGITKWSTPKATDGAKGGLGQSYGSRGMPPLGCKVDDSRHKSQSYTHDDAEIVAATLAGMLDSWGGNRMAIHVAELARAGMTSDWLPGVVPARAGRDQQQPAW